MLHISDETLANSVNMLGAVIFALILAYHWIDVNGGRDKEN